MNPVANQSCTEENIQLADGITMFSRLLVVFFSLYVFRFGFNKSPTNPTYWSVCNAFIISSSLLAWNVLLRLTRNVLFLHAKPEIISPFNWYCWYKVACDIFYCLLPYNGGEIEVLMRGRNKLQIHQEELINLEVKSFKAYNAQSAISAKKFFKLDFRIS